MRPVLFLCLISIFISCRSKNDKAILAPEKMEAVLFDFVMAEAYTNTHVNVDSVILAQKENAKLQKKVFRFASGTPVSTFVQNHGSVFMSAVNDRQKAFGENRLYIHDVPRAAMAASLVAYLNPRPDHGYGAFVAPPGLDLSSLVLRGDAILLAWVPNYAPMKPMNKFSPRRSDRNTLFRLAVPVPQ